MFYFWHANCKDVGERGEEDKTYRTQRATPEDSTRGNRRDKRRRGVGGRRPGMLKKEIRRDREMYRRYMLFQVACQMRRSEGVDSVRTLETEETDSRLGGEPDW
jgi:hypothetical protein